LREAIYGAEEGGHENKALHVCHLDVRMTDVLEYEGSKERLKLVMKIA
jgi:hypothetical protein